MAHHVFSRAKRVQTQMCGLYHHPLKQESTLVFKGAGRLCTVIVGTHVLVSEPSTEPFLVSRSPL